MKIYTKTGDNGTTSLFGGKRVAKNDLRIVSYGTVDELNSILGIVLLNIENKDLKNIILKIQNSLFNLGGDLATPVTGNDSKLYIKRIDNSSTKFLETTIDFFESQLPQLKSFILPGGNSASAHLHLARTVCRRAERIVVSLNEIENINNNIIIYLNRLSDLLFVLARYLNHLEGIPDVEWQK